MLWSLSYEGWWWLVVVVAMMMMLMAMVTIIHFCAFCSHKCFNQAETRQPTA